MADVELLPGLVAEGLDYFDMSGDEGDKQYVRAIRQHIAAKDAEIEALRAEVERLREALKELITWIPSADTYRRLGFDPEAPMRALGAAQAALSKENKA